MAIVKSIIPMLVALPIVFPNYALGNGKNNLCQRKVNALACLKTNFDALYSENFDRFWVIAHESAAKAEKCNSLPDTIAFLDLVRTKSDNAEFNEFFSEVIERMITRKRTECLLGALAEMDKVSQGLIMEKLRHPIFLESEAIERALKSTQDEKYKPVVDRYFQRK